MTDTIPAILTYDGPTPTYIAVNITDDITVDARTIIHLYNDSAVNDVIVFYLSDLPCQTVLIPPGDELILGLFNVDSYAPTLTIIHSQTADVTMTVLTIGGIQTQYLQQDGLTPNYSIMPPADTFEHAGNEIICIKNSGYETPHEYTLTVGESEYVLTIPANRCAFIRPPIRATEIHYDTESDLEITILKEPTT
jgi:hypothetical protein